MPTLNKTETSFSRLLRAPAPICRSPRTAGRACGGLRRPRRRPPLRWGEEEASAGAASSTRSKKKRPPRTESDQTESGRSERESKRHSSLSLPFVSTKKRKGERQREGRLSSVSRSSFCVRPPVLSPLGNMDYAGCGGGGGGGQEQSQGGGGGGGTMPSSSSQRAAAQAPPASSAPTTARQVMIRRG